MEGNNHDIEPNKKETEESSSSINPDNSTIENSEKEKKRKPPITKIKFLILVILISLSAIWLFNFLLGDKPYWVDFKPKHSKAEIKESCYKHIDFAKSKAVATVENRVYEFSDFIESHKSGVQPFSKDMVSFRSKWMVVKPFAKESLKSYLEIRSFGGFIILEKIFGVESNIEKLIKKKPIFDKNSHKDYVTEKFQEYIFSNEQLAQVINRCIEESIKDIEGIENELAVALRSEILGHSLKPDEIPIANQLFQSSIERIITATKWDVAKSVGNLVVSEVFLMVFRNIFVKLGVSSSILGAGAANSWWTYGGSIVIGVIADVIWESIDDPAGDIEREVLTALDKLSINISTAMKEKMTEIISQRSSLWSKVVEERLL